MLICLIKYKITGMAGLEIFVNTFGQKVLKRCIIKSKGITQVISIHHEGGDIRLKTTNANFMVPKVIWIYCLGKIKMSTKHVPN